MIMTVLCNYGLISFNDSVELETLIQMTIISVAAAVYLFTTCIKFGKINEMSKTMVNSWKRKYSKVQCFENNDLMRVYFNSCRFLRIDVGCYGHYRKATTLPTIGKIFVYTAKFTLTMNKVFWSELIIRMILSFMYLTVKRQKIWCGCTVCALCVVRKLIARKLVAEKTYCKEILAYSWVMTWQLQFIVII